MFYLFENLCHTFYLFIWKFYSWSFFVLFQGDCGGAEEYRWHLAQIIKEVNNYCSYTLSTPQYIPQGPQYIFYHCPSLLPQSLSPITVHSPTLSTPKYIPPKPEPSWFQHLFEALLPEDLGRHCWEWPAGKTDLEITFLSFLTANHGIS